LARDRRQAHDVYVLWRHDFGLEHRPRRLRSLWNLEMRLTGSFDRRQWSLLRVEVGGRTGRGPLDSGFALPNDADDLDALAGRILKRAAHGSSTEHIVGGLFVHHDDTAGQRRVSTAEQAPRQTRHADGGNAHREEYATGEELA